MRIVKEQIIVNGKTFNITLEFAGKKKPEDIVALYAHRLIEVMKENGEL